MKVEARFLLAGFAFFLVCTILYWYFARDIVGIMLLLFTAGLSIIAGWYIHFTSKAVYPRPEDRLDGNIEEADPEYGFFSPHSWWPLAVGFSAFVFVLGFIFAAWMFLFGIICLTITVTGWLFEYYTGDHAH